MADPFKPDKSEPEPKEPKVGRVVSAQAWECPACKREMAIPEKSACDCGLGVSPVAKRVQLPEFSKTL